MFDLEKFEFDGSYSVVYRVLRIIGFPRGPDHERDEHVARHDCARLRPGRAGPASYFAAGGFAERAWGWLHVTPCRVCWLLPVNAFLG